jgi:DNA-binding CsgD family transcriptional regulator
MTRPSRAGPWSQLVLRLRRSMHAGRLQLAAHTHAERWRISFADPQHRAALAQAGAVGAALALLMINGARGGLAGSEAVVWIAILLGFAALRVATAKRRLATSTIVLDAVGTAVFMAGTGGPTSPFLLVALAGVWWSTDVGRGVSAQAYRIDRSSSELRVVPDSVVEVGGRRPGWLVYGLTFTVAYALLVVPSAMRTGAVSEAVEDIAIFVIVALLSEWFSRVQRLDAHTTRSARVPVLGAEQMAIRQGLARALRTLDIPIDMVLSAGQVGLTAIQAELLAYLVLGLTNLEIADAIQVSESTVRYRLTRLYRTLGVTGRREAAERARMLGLTAVQSGVAANRSA